MRIQKGDGGAGDPDPLNIGFLSNAGPDPLKNNKATTKPAFNFGPLSARKRNAI